jgi:TonB family protein
VRFLILLVALAAFAQDASREVYRTGPGVKPPKVQRKQNPGYTRQAFYARVQGRVVCEVIVDERGKPVHVAVLSPLGYGLDEMAVASVRQWQFKPGEKDGAPAKVVTTVEVTFRLHGTWFNDRAERRRSDFNVAITNLRRRDAALQQEAAKRITELAGQKYPPALHVRAKFLFAGSFGEKDVEAGLALLRESADKNFAPAMSDLGQIYLSGELAPRDSEKGLQLLRDAAVLGSTQAQFFLGEQYEAGEIVPKELDRARRYFRLCAAAGRGQCQYRLAKLMLEAEGRQEWEYLQGVAWAMLAADRGVRDARSIVNAETPKLTPEQMEWARKLRAQLLRRR